MEGARPHPLRPPGRLRGLTPRLAAEADIRVRGEGRPWAEVSLAPPDDGRDSRQFWVKNLGERAHYAHRNEFFRPLPCSLALYCLNPAMATRPEHDGQPWTREQLVLAFELYCRIPFQHTKATDHRVKDLGELVGRTPASVARKLGNFGAFDPQLAARNISGLTHGSKLGRTVWDEFHQDWNRLIVLAHDIKRKLNPQGPDRFLIRVPTGSSERIVTAKQRLHQAFFRDAVLSSYNTRCCVTGLPTPECLVAGHIIPWSKNESRRADPTNGVCLSATFDRLFDCGHITIDDNYTLRVSGFLRSSKDHAVSDIIASREGRPILLPSRFCPDRACLAWHRKYVFQDV